ncbi:acyltransferase [Pseudomonas sp. MG-9]|uniref:Acyltransferase n=1 Tax=Pseudomonas serboccidentalis TaxID=2964670 RepID=A0ABY7Z568_9PSED|nr:MULTISPECIES: acyltransferase [Pseudomonas]MBT9268110.1 acyltransferase [Pseudomonas sp. MG-9]WDR34308.1 acyltransferase [Pseudomonas serboccidentalis]
MKFYNLQAMRGVAACMVFLIHLLSTKHGLGADWFLFKWWWVGPAGVDLFFVISGFIVCYTAAKAGREDLAPITAATRFGIKRLFRVYPVYWIVLAVSFALAPYVQTADPGMAAERVWRLVTLATTNNNRVVLAWTLCYELFFYLVLALIILIRPKQVYELVLGWIALQIGLTIWASGGGLQMFNYVPLSPLILEFGAGCILAFMVDRGVKAYGWQSLMAGVALFCVAVWAHSQNGNWAPWWRSLYFTIPCALIVYGAIAIEISSGVTLPAWLQKVGDSSYSIYIWHQLVLAILLKLTEMSGLFDVLPGLLILFIWGVIALAFGFLSYQVIEKPSQNWIHRVMKRPERRELSHI